MQSLNNKNNPGRRRRMNLFLNIHCLRTL